MLSPCGVNQLPGGTALPGLTRGVSGSDGGDGDWQHLGAALLSVLIVAAIIACGRSRLQEVRAYLQKVLQLTTAAEKQEEVKEGAGRSRPPTPRTAVRRLMRGENNTAQQRSGREGRGLIHE